MFDGTGDDQLRPNTNEKKSQIDARVETLFSRYLHTLIDRRTNAGMSNCNPLLNPP
jgi:hypothetical protein